MNRKIFSTFLLAVLTFIFFLNCFAKTINLYEQPKLDAKVLGTLNLDKSISITIVNKEKEWTSIVDPTVKPENARIAWIRTVDLPTNNYTFTQTMVNTGKGSQSYVMQYGVPQPLTEEQAAEITKQIKAQQKAVENYFSQMTQDMIKNARQFNMGYPFIMPVIVVPASKP